MDDQTKPKRKMRCPICEKDSQPDTKPFCSARCAEIDLWKWLSASYVLPGDDDEPQCSEFGTSEETFRSTH